ncbi:hypothetical protein GCM10017752_09840 [Streptomyces roseoviridis]
METAHTVITRSRVRPALRQRAGMRPRRSATPGSPFTRFLPPAWHNGRRAGAGRRVPGGVRRGRAGWAVEAAVEVFRVA